MARPILCLVVDPRAAKRELASAVAAAVAGGVDWVQVRDRELEALELLALAESLARAAREAARRRGSLVRVLVNRRADVALAAGADGVHLGFDGLPAQEARRLLGEAAWIGISAHAPEEVGRALPAASYAQLAPIFAPLSKPSSRPPLGVGALRRAAGAGIPVLAQGGIDAGNAGSALAAGAAGVAVTGAILLADDPGAAAAALRAALDAGYPDRG
jgi:thiamine-phosphate pyrophosphorylase